MAIRIVSRQFYLPSIRRTRRIISLLVAVPRLAPNQPLVHVSVRRHIISRTGGRKKTLFLGLLVAGKLNKNVVLYKKPNGFPTQFYPKLVYRRPSYRAAQAGIAPIIAVGGGGNNMNLQHALGLSLMALGGMRY